MRPGDLVRGKQGSFKGTPLVGIIIKESDPRRWMPGAKPCAPLVGIIIKESDRSNTWGDERHQWWTVLCEGGALVDEVEELLEVIHETR